MSQNWKSIVAVQQKIAAIIFGAADRKNCRYFLYVNSITARDFFRFLFFFLSSFLHDTYLGWNILRAEFVEPFEFRQLEQSHKKMEEFIEWVNILLDNISINSQTVS